MDDHRWIMCLVWSLTDPGRANSTVIVNTAVSNTAGVGPGAQDQSRYEPQAAVSASVAESATSADGDAACWDSLPDKNDPDCLEEYLVRFPKDVSRRSLPGSSCAWAERHPSRRQAACPSLARGAAVLLRRTRASAAAAAREFPLQSPPNRQEPA